MLLVILTSRLNSTEQHILETCVRQFSRGFYYVLNPVNTLNISVGQAVVNQRERNFSLKETSKEATIKYKKQIASFYFVLKKSFSSEANLRLACRTGAIFLRILGAQRRKRGERETRVACERRSTNLFFSAPPLARYTRFALASLSPLFA